MPSVLIRTDDLSLTGGLRCQLRYEGIDLMHTPMRRVRNTWRALRASNPQPLVLETSALPIELSTQELNVERATRFELACAGLEDQPFTT